MNSGKLFIISAPSGAGKTTLVKELFVDCATACMFQRAITYTTRPPREGEIDGFHYHFLSIDEFKKKIENDFFIEWSTWYDHYYGSARSLIDQVKNGLSYILIVDRLGARDILSLYKDAVLIWIQPPSIEELRQRLLHRAKDSVATIEARLKKAEIEIEQERVECLYRYHIINNNFHDAFSELKEKIIFEMNKIEKNKQ